MSIYQDLLDKKKAISVTGLGYVGLPLALEFAKHFKVIGFDISENRIQMMKNGEDPSRELEASSFENVDIYFTSNAEDLKDAHFHIIGVPTDIDEHKVPNLMPLLSASKDVGRALKPGDYVVYESTVYPGCTEEDCLPILEKESGLLLSSAPLREQDESDFSSTPLRTPGINLGSERSSTPLRTPGINLGSERSSTPLRTPSINLGSDFSSAPLRTPGINLGSERSSTPLRTPGINLGSERSSTPLRTPSINLGSERSRGFSLGYSPERINPGDKVRTLTNILKIVSGHNEESLDQVAKVYGHIIKAGVYRATSIKVAEAAKVIENTQRDINISLMNELAIIFDKVGIDTNEVIEAAGSKWNFHKYRPGLVGGHCIGVDPFYLMHKAKQIGHDPQVIAAGRRVNDRIPHFIAKRVVTTLIEKGKNPSKCKVLVMGITFKEDVSDIRNSKVADLIKELEDYSLSVDVIDPHASFEEVKQEYDIKMKSEADDNYDAIVMAVGHEEYRSLSCMDLEKLSDEELLLFDIKGIKAAAEYKNYWRL